MQIDLFFEIDVSKDTAKEEDNIHKLTSNEIIEKWSIVNKSAISVKDLKPGDICEVYHEKQAYVARVLKYEILSDGTISFVVFLIAKFQVCQDVIIRNFNWWSTVRPVKWLQINEIIKIEDCKGWAHLFYKEHNSWCRKKVHDLETFAFLDELNLDFVECEIFYMPWIGILVCDLKPNDFCEVLHESKWYVARLVAQLNDLYHVRLVVSNIEKKVNLKELRSLGCLLNGKFNNVNECGIEITLIS